MLEYEKKVLLTEAEYTCLKKLANDPSLTATQINHYFDTDDFAMNQKGITYRVRLKNGMYQPTIKYHSPESRSDNNCSLEEDREKTTTFNPDAFSDLGLSWQGTLQTERTVLYKDSFYEMVVDRNTYLGTSDYELEIEYAEGCEAGADRMLIEAGKCLVASNLLDCEADFLSRVGRSSTKSERFFEKKKKSF